MKTKRKPKKLFILCVVLDSLAIFCLLLFYGPFTGFRDFIVTTAMSTMSHKYLARTFYTQNMIDKVLSRNYIEDLGTSTDASIINVGNIEEKEVYESIYEEQILKREKNQKFKVIDVEKTSEYNVHMVVVYDPSDISLFVTPTLGSYGLTITEIAEKENASVAINASGFEDKDGQGSGGFSTGTIIKDGKVIWEGIPTGWQGGLIGFNYDNVLVLTKDSPLDAITNGMKDAIEFGPFLIVNGEAAYTKGNGGTGIHPRTIIAQRQDGIVLLLAIDGNGNNYGYRGGMNYYQIIELLQRYGAYNAANLDGGASTSLAFNKLLYNKPCGIGGTGERALPTAWVVK